MSLDLIIWALLGKRFEFKRETIIALLFSDQKMNEIQEYFFITCI